MKNFILGVVPGTIGVGGLLLLLVANQSPSPESAVIEVQNSGFDSFARFHTHCLHYGNVAIEAVYIPPEVALYVPLRYQATEKSKQLILVIY